VPDPIFADQRLARIYDGLDADRTDLDHYDAIVDELGARSVLDIGCGTGTFACRLAARGIEVVGVDPAEASLDVARAKPGAERVTWRLGDATSLPHLQVDLAVMTGNVAQVFVTDGAWAVTLNGIREALRPGGHIVFEVRDPGREAWRSWTADESRRDVDLPGVGRVERWVDLTEVDLPLVSFRWTYRFERTGASIVSDSTLRFRERGEVEASLDDAGYAVIDVRDAPDRPGLELVFVAERAR
jgi:SAM-dependent methyltransferase